MGSHPRSPARAGRARWGDGSRPSMVRGSGVVSVSNRPSLVRLARAFWGFSRGTPAILSWEPVRGVAAYLDAFCPRRGPREGQDGFHPRSSSPAQCRGHQAGTRRMPSYRTGPRRVEYKDPRHDGYAGQSDGISPPPGKPTTSSEPINCWSIPRPTPSLRTKPTMPRSG